jgi:transcriptional regulator with XRE-family HTH domain
MISDEKLQELFYAAKIGHRLIIKRKKLKMSKSDFAKEIGVSSYTLSKYEKEEATPAPDKIKKIFQLLELDLEQFLTERHQHILDVRFLLKEERNLIRKRINELKDTIRFYEYKEEEIDDLIEEECSFATEYEDVDVEFSFSGNGIWLSDKIYLTNGVYVFDVEQNDNISLSLVNIAEQDERKYIYGEAKEKFKVPIIINETGYYLIHIDRADKWSLHINKQNNYSNS